MSASIEKFEKFWQVVQDLFSLLLSYFVAQYVLIIVVNFLFCLKIYFSFQEITFFVRSLKYVYFHCEYYPNCVTSVTNILDLRYSCEHDTLFSHLNLNPLSLLKLTKKHLFFGEYFCPTYFFYVEK